MSKFLKGNYPLKNTEASEPAASKPKNIANEFEEKALEKLGGSIAYVMKSNSFLWDGEEES
jgi:hypothetical protein